MVIAITRSTASDIITVPLTIYIHPLDKVGATIALDVGHTSSIESNGYYLVGRIVASKVIATSLEHTLENYHRSLRW